MPVIRRLVGADQQGTGHAVASGEPRDPVRLAAGGIGSGQRGDVPDVAVRHQQRDEIAGARPVRPDVQPRVVVPQVQAAIQVEQRDQQVGGRTPFLEGELQLVHQAAHPVGIELHLDRRAVTVGRDAFALHRIARHESGRIRADIAWNLDHVPVQQQPSQQPVERDALAGAERRRARRAPVCPGLVDRDSADRVDVAGSLGRSGPAGESRGPDERGDRQRRKGSIPRQPLHDSDYK